MKHYINEKKVKRLNNYLELIEEMSIERLKQYIGKLNKRDEKQIDLLISVLMGWELLIINTLERGYYVNEDKLNLENIENFYQKMNTI